MIVDPAKIPEMLIGKKIINVRKMMQSPVLTFDDKTELMIYYWNYNNGKKKPVAIEPKGNLESEEGYEPEEKTEGKSRGKNRRGTKRKVAGKGGKVKHNNVKASNTSNKKRLGRKVK